MSLAFDLTASILPDCGLKLSTPLISSQQGHVQGVIETQEMELPSLGISPRPSPMAEPK